MAISSIDSLRTLPRLVCEVCQLAYDCLDSPCISCMYVAVHIKHPTSSKLPDDRLAMLAINCNLSVATLQHLKFKQVFIA